MYPISAQYCSTGEEALFEWGRPLYSKCLNFLMIKLGKIAPRHSQLWSLLN